jgi:iron complex outermembrane receptor protein
MLRKIKLGVLTVGILLFALVQTGLAGETKGEEDIFELGEIIVTATPMAEVEDVVSQEEIRKVKTSQTVDGLLEDLAGIDLYKTSPGGDRGRGVKIRGFDESRCLILLDGRPLNGAGVYGGHYVDWSSLSTEDIECIEVSRGAKSAEYGNILGGVINIVTKRGTREPVTDLRLSYGGKETGQYMISHSNSFKDLIFYNLSLGHWETDGYLRNNYVDRNNFAGRLSFLLPGDASLGLGARYTTHELGFIAENESDNPYYDSSYPESAESGGGGPGLAWKGNAKYWGDGSYWKNKRGQYDIELRKNFDSLKLKAQAYLNDQDRQEYYFAVDDRDKLVLQRYTEPEKNTWGWLLKGTQPVSKHNLRYGLEGAYLGYGPVDVEYADNSYFKRPPSSSSERTKAIQRHSPFVQDSWEISDRLTLNMGLRYDKFEGEKLSIISSDSTAETNLEGWSPKLGASLSTWEGGTVDASLVKTYRFPTCPEFYWYYVGNQPPDRKSLSAEDATQVEIEISHRFKDGGKIGLRPYYYEVDDYIRTIFGYRPSRVVYNIDKTRFHGVEVEGEYRLYENLHIFGNYTYQTTKKDGDILDTNEVSSDKLVELPEHKANLGLSYRAKNGAILDLTARYRGDRQDLGTWIRNWGKKDATPVDVDDFVTVDLNFSYPIFNGERASGTIRLGVENLFDEDYEEVYGFPMPGRTITGGINIVF